jgi:WD40 repeat protein
VPEDLKMGISKRTVAAGIIFSLVTSVLFVINRERRRARVPAMIFKGPEQAVRRNYENGISALVFGPKSEQLLLGDFFGFTYLVDVRSKTLRQLQGQRSIEAFHSGSLSWNERGDRIYHSIKGEFRWKQVEDFHWRNFAALGDRIFWHPKLSDAAQASLSPQGRFILTSQNSMKNWRELTLINALNGRQVWKIGLDQPTHANDIVGNQAVCGLLFSPDERYFAVATIATPLPAQFHITLRRVKGGSVLSQILLFPRDALIIGGSSNELSMTFSPDGLLLAVVGYEEVRLFSTKSGLLLAKLPRSPQNNISFESPPVKFSPNGRLLAVSYYTAIEVWSVEQNKLLQLFMPGSPDLSFSADSKWLASIGYDKAKEGAYVWEVSSLLK